MVPLRTPEWASGPEVRDPLYPINCSALSARRAHPGQADSSGDEVVGAEVRV